MMFSVASINKRRCFKTMSKEASSHQIILILRFLLFKKKNSYDNKTKNKKQKTNTRPQTDNDDQLFSLY